MQLSWLMMCLSHNHICISHPTNIRKSKNTSQRCWNCTLRELLCTLPNEKKRRLPEHLHELVDESESSVWTERSRGSGVWSGRSGVCWDWVQVWQTSDVQVPVTDVRQRQKLNQESAVQPPIQEEKSRNSPKTTAGAQISSRVPVSKPCDGISNACKFADCVFFREALKEVKNS